MASGLFQLIRRRQAVLWTLFAGLALTAALGWELHREAVEMDRQRLARRVSDIQSQLDSRVEKSEMLLNNLRDYLRLSGENRSFIVNRWCYDSGLTINCPWVHGIVVATNQHTPEWRNEFPNPPQHMGNRGLGEAERSHVQATGRLRDCVHEQHHQHQTLSGRLPTPKLQRGQ